MGWPEASQGVLRAALRTFGEDVVYTPPGGAPETVRGIFHEEPQEVDVGLEVAVSSAHLTVGVRAADLVAEPVVDATIDVRGRLYRVIEVEGPDEAGEAILVVHRSDA